MLYLSLSRVELRCLGVVAEGFVYFFDKDDLAVYKVPRIRLQLSQLASIPIILAVAGGENKVQT